MVVPVDGSACPVVVGIGAATWDELWIVDEFSSEEGVNLAHGSLRQGGGPVATALCVLSKLGHRVALIDICGDDDIGAQIRMGLDECGVDTRFVQSATGKRSSKAVILVRARDGARQIHYLPSDAGQPSLDQDAESLIRRARLLHLNGRHEDAAREAVQLARHHDIAVSFDGGAGRYRSSLHDLVAASNVIIVARDFAEQYSRATDLAEMAKALRGNGADLVVITDGLLGSHVWTADGTSFHQPARQATPHVVDTTGCGDAYHGAFLHGWLQRWPAAHSAEFASSVAALNASGLGGRFVCRQGFPELESLTSATEAMATAMTNP